MARRRNENIHRVRWAAIAHFRFNEGLNWDRAKEAAAKALHSTIAAGAEKTIFQSYCSQADHYRHRKNRDELARKWFEGRDAILQRPSERAAKLILDELKEAAEPLTMRDLETRTGLIYRTLNSTCSRLHARGLIRRHSGLYCALSVQLPPEKPNCLQALQLTNRQLATGDLRRLTGKSADAVGAEIRRRIKSGEVIQVARAKPGEAAAFGLAKKTVVLPTQNTRTHSLAPTAEISIVCVLLQARGQPRTNRQLEKLTGKSESAIYTGVRRLIEDGKVFRHDRGLYGLSPPDC